MSPGLAATLALCAATLAGGIVMLRRSRKIRLDHERLNTKSQDLADQLGHAVKELDKVRKQVTQLELRLAQQSLIAAVSEHATDGACVCTPKGEIEWVNPAWEQVTGYSLADSHGKRPGKLLQGPGTDPATVERLRAAIRARQPITEELCNYSKSGTKLWIRLHVEPILGPTGSLLGYVGTQTDLTLRRVTQKRLERLNEKAELALSAGDYGIWEWWPQPNRCEWDERSLKLYGIATAPANYEAWMQLVHKPDQAALETHLRAVLLGREHLEASFRVLLPDRSLRHLQIHGRLQRDASGSPHRMTGLVRDITPEMRMKEQLQFAAERLRLSLHGANAGVWEWNMDADQLAFDEGWYSLTGIPQPAVALHRADFERHLHPEDIQPLRRSLEAHLSGKAPFFETDCRISLHGHDWLWVKLRGSLLGGGREGQPSMLCGTYGDVTEQHRTEAALRRSALLLRQMCQQMGIAAWQIEAESFALHWTEELDLLHRAPADFEPSLENLLALYPVESRRELSRMLEAAIERQEAFDIELRWKPGDADTNSWFRWSGQPVLADGKVQAICGLVQDITGQQESSAQRRELDQRLAELHQYEALGAITEDLAHDLNDLLGRMIGFQELASGEIPAENTAQDFLREALRASNRTSDIVRQVLLLNRKPQALRVVTRLPLLADELCEELKRILPPSLLLHRTIDRRCPPVLGDASQLQQAFRSIARHAASMLEGRPGRMELVLRTEDVSLATAASLGLTLQGAFACLEIRVELSALTEAEWSKLSQTPSNEHDRPLRQARELLSEHHGVLWTEYHPVHGALCQAWLPLASTLQAQPPSSQRLPLGAGERIIIIDHERFIAHLARISLERHGFGVTVFRSLSETTQALVSPELPCDLVLTGSSIPAHRIDELITELRGVRPGLPVVVLYSEGQRPASQACITLGAPFTAAELCFAIDEALHPERQPTRG
jgi:PAS domain S-box-containing protein